MLLQLNEYLDAVDADYPEAEKFYTGNSYEDRPMYGIKVKS